jgi:regulator of replication initiation timing
MELKDSDRLDLRVYAINSRLKEVSTEISQARGEAYELRQQIEEQTVSSLMDGNALPDDLNQLKGRLAERESIAERQEAEEIRLKQVLLMARREHLRQIKKERPRRWMILE